VTRPPHPPLAGRLVRLEPLRPDHGPALRALAQDAPQVFRWMSTAST
jgi:hypothetical protein